MPEGVSDGLFDLTGAPAHEPHEPGATSTPLAVRMRPASLDEVVGQDHLLGPGSPLRRLVDGSGAASVSLSSAPPVGDDIL